MAGFSYYQALEMEHICAYCEKEIVGKYLQVPWVDEDGIQLTTKPFHPICKKKAEAEAWHADYSSIPLAMLMKRGSIERRNQQRQKRRQESLETWQV